MTAQADLATGLIPSNLLLPQFPLFSKPPLTVHNSPGPTHQHPFLIKDFGLIPQRQKNTIPFSLLPFSLPETSEARQNTSMAGVAAGGDGGGDG